MATAVDQAIGRLRANLSTGEILLGLAALLVAVVAWLIFGILLGRSEALPSDVTLAASLIVLVVLWLQTSGRHDLGHNAHLLLAGLGLLIGFLIAVDAVQTIRYSGFTSNATGLIGQIILWVGGVLALAGAWIVWRDRSAAP
jgi:hypothetical protein